MDHRGFFDLIRSKWLVLVSFALLGTIAATAYAALDENEYSAQAELFVATVGSDNASDLAQGSNYSQQQARIYSVVATRQEVLQPVIERLDLDTTVRDLSGQVSVSVPLNTSLITISVADTDPERAAETADAVASSLIDSVIRLVPKRSDGTTPVRLETIQNAIVPTVPSGPGLAVLLVGGLLAGVVAGLAVIVLRELSSPRVRTRDQVRHVDGLAVLGSVVHDRQVGRSPLAARPGSARFEEFRQIRTNLKLAAQAGSQNVFVITSSIPREGRSTTAANLAVALAASGDTVCLVEADLRSPSLARTLGMDATEGFTSVVAGEAVLDDALRTWGDDGLRVLLSGPIPHNPSEFLESAGALEVLDELSERFDFLLLDVPPLLPVADAAVLAGAFGSAVLVVGSGDVETSELRSSVEGLRAADVVVLGAVLNNVPQRAAGRFRDRYARRRSQVAPPVVPTASRPTASRGAVKADVGAPAGHAIEPGLATPGVREAGLAAAAARESDTAASSADSASDDAPRSYASKSDAASRDGSTGSVVEAVDADAPGAAASEVESSADGTSRSEASGTETSATSTSDAGASDVEHVNAAAPEAAGPEGTATGDASSGDGSGDVSGPSREHDGRSPESESEGVRGEGRYDDDLAGDRRDGAAEADEELVPSRSARTDRRG